ncbi:MAG: phytanoyl-CoA dioxygenase [Cryomorphaceae bacterium]|nr:phytanoyl-CoA dioxygenase [Cryomorphaceae bacterium]
MARLVDKYWGVLRRFKPAYHLYNFTQKKLLVRNKALYAKWGLKKSIYAPLSSSDFKGAQFSEHAKDTPWSDRATSIQGKPGWENLKPQIQNSLSETWVDSGFAILKGYFDSTFIDAVNMEVEQLMESKEIDFNYSGRKIMFAYRKGQRLGEIAFDKGICDALDYLMGKQMKPFQSINFEMSSEQRAHSDSIHMTTFPAGYMAAAWVALEDIGPDQGPLQYYPSSHKLDYILNDTFDHGGSSVLLGENAYLHYEEHIQKLIRDKALQPVTLHVKKGDVFLWHGNLLHGAIKMNDRSLTRKSMVVHYFSPEVICYHELTQRPALIELDKTK